MPTENVVIDFQGASVPKRDSRLALANSANTATLSPLTAVSMIPESSFQKAAGARAVDAVFNQNMGARDQIVRGVTGKKETYASLEIIQPGDKGPVLLLKFEEFLLQSASEASQERFQSIETFGDTIGFFFGSRPKFYTYTGTLLNTEDYQWKDKWAEVYEKNIRGTKCVEKKARAYLTYDYVLREGYILQMNVSQISAHPNHVDFTFSMFITREMCLAPLQALASKVEQVKSATSALTSTVRSVIKTMTSLPKQTSNAVPMGSRAATQGSRADPELVNRRLFNEERDLG